MRYTTTGYPPIRYAHKMHAYEMPAHGMHAHGMHTREIYTRKYMLMGCTPEITALIFPKVYLKLVLYRER
jgi:hypothetical protein